MGPPWIAELKGLVRQEFDPVRDVDGGVLELELFLTCRIVEAEGAFPELELVFGRCCFGEEVTGVDDFLPPLCSV